MKKVLLSVFTLALILAVTTTGVFAAGHGRRPGDGTGSGSCTGANCLYADADGDGVCDYRGSGCNHGLGNSFVDGNGDGICDNLGTGVRPMDGTGHGYGCHGGRNR